MPLKQVTVSPSLIDHSFSTAFVELFASATYSENFNPYLNSTLSEEIPSLFKFFNLASFALTGSYLNLDENTLAVSSKNGAFDKLYFPILVKNGDTVGIRWGKEVKPVTFYPANSKLTSNDVEYSLETTVDSFTDDYGDQPCFTLRLLNKKANTLVKMNFPLNRIDLEVKASTIRDAYSVDPANLLDYLGEPKVFSPYTKLGYTPVGRHKATLIKATEPGKYGVQYRITLVSDEPVEVGFINQDKELEYREVTEWQVTANQKLEAICKAHLAKYPDGTLPEGSEVAIFSAREDKGKVFCDAALTIPYEDRLSSVPEFEF